MRRGLETLANLFDASERDELQGLPIRVTARGLWVPTPSPVLRALFRATRARGLFRSTNRRLTVLDAGMGDGRVLATLAFFEPDLDLVGIEADGRLFRRAVANVKAVARDALIERPERLRLLQGDYCEPVTYAAAGIGLETVAFVLNYPDGNQEALERFLIAHAAPGTLLCLLTHDPALRLATLALASRERLSLGGASGDWHWSVYST